MPSSAKQSNEWLVLQPGSIDEVPQCHPKVNLARVDLLKFQFGDRRSGCQLTEAIQLPRRDWYREVGMAPQFQHQMGAGKCMAPWAFFVTNPTNEPKMSVCIPAPPWVFFKGPTRTFHQLLLCENARPQSSDCRIDPGF